MDRFCCHVRRKIEQDVRIAVRFHLVMNGTRNDVTRSEILESLYLVARGEVFPLVTVVRPLEEAEAVHELVERGDVIGRAVLRVG